MPPDLLTLRRQLRTQFPEAHRTKDPSPALLSLTGLPAFPRGALSELSPATPASSLSLLLAQLLERPQASPEAGPRTTAHHSPTTGLIDATDSFDPASYGPEACARLLWIRCTEPSQSLRCTDLLLRDGNLPLLLLDLQLVPLRDLLSRSFPPTAWYRLRNLAEQSGTTLLVCTPQLILPCAALQLTLTNSFTLPDLDRDRENLSILSQQISHAMTANS